MRGASESPLHVTPGLVLRPQQITNMRDIPPSLVHEVWSPLEALHYAATLLLQRAPASSPKPSSNDRKLEPMSVESLGGWVGWGRGQ